MNRTTKLIVPFVLTLASSLAMAEGGSARTLQHSSDTSDAKPTLKALLKDGDVLSIAPAGTAGTTGMIRNYDSRNTNQTYEMKVRTPDGQVHTVEFLSAPVGVNNG